MVVMGDLADGTYWPRGWFARQRARAASLTGYGWCGRCGRSWGTADGHPTEYRTGRSMFPLCEPCWQKLGTPERRFPYYKRLADHWRRSTPDDVMGVPTDAALRFALRREVIDA